MVLQSSGPIKFSELRAEFNLKGTGSIKFSHYYSDATTNYTNGTSGIPVKLNNSIKMSIFYGKIMVIAAVYLYGVLNNTITNNIILTLTNSSELTGYIIFYKNINCKILLVGSGGAGGNNIGGGGSGGSVYYNDNYNFLPSINYDFIVPGTTNTVGSIAVLKKNSATEYMVSGGKMGANGNNSNFGGIGGSVSRTITVINNVQTEFPGIGLYYVAGYSGTTNKGSGGAGAGGDSGSFGSSREDPGPGFNINITGTNVAYGRGGFGGLANSVYTQSTNYGAGGNGNKINSVGQTGKQGCFIISIDKTKIN
jgi:hypothetical protein